ncbi:MAG: hypothetical protein ACI8PZ_002444, partial [Myxococcota bacterium]
MHAALARSRGIAEYLGHVVVCRGPLDAVGEHTSLLVRRVQRLGQRIAEAAAPVPTLCAVVAPFPTIREDAARAVVNEVLARI